MNNLQYQVQVILTKAALSRLSGSAGFGVESNIIQMGHNLHLGDHIVLPEGERLRVLRRTWRLDVEPPVLELELDWPARG